jgi:hypothetical protein
MEKRYEALKAEINKLFLSVEAKDLEADYSPTFLAVLSGCSNG